jgi:phage tail tape-measure protein
MFALARLQWAGIALAVLVVTHTGAYAAGWFRGVASERAVWQAERSRIMVEAAATAERLRGEGKRLAAELEVARVNVRVEYVEKVRYLVRVASPTRECLSPDVTATLNRTPIRETVERPGEPPRTVDPPESTGGTSELAAAEWIAGAQAAHAECRSQVARLADWIRSVTTRTP